MFAQNHRLVTLPFEWRMHGADESRLRRRCKHPCGIHRSVPFSRVHLTQVRRGFALCLNFGDDRRSNGKAPLTCHVIRPSLPSIRRT